MVTPLRGVAAAIVLAVCASRVEAQLGGAVGMLFGGNVSVVLPTEGLQDRWKIGIGGGLVVEPRISERWRASFEFGATRLIGKTRTTPDGEDRVPDNNFWEFAAGPRYAPGGGKVFVGVDGAYYVFSLNGAMGVDDQPGVLPVIGYRTEGFGVTLRYKLVSDAHWAQVRFSFSGLR